MSAPAHVLVLRPIIDRLRHAGHDVEVTAREYTQTLELLEANMHDYEFAVLQHRIGCRLATRVIFPDAVPPERLRRFGVGAEKLRQYPGLKEEYYLHDFEPNGGVLDGLGVDAGRVVVVVRPPPDVSLYHRKSNPLFPQVLAHVGTHDGVSAVVLP